MTGNERRAMLLSVLQEANSPIKGNDLADKFQVSRQIIVQDIALLRAANHPILSTTSGYLFLH